MKEREEIKERLVDYKMEVLKLASRQAVSDIEFLLSSLEAKEKEFQDYIQKSHINYFELKKELEKEEQSHVMSIYDLNMKNAEIGIALEKEKERTEKVEERIKNLFEIWETESNRANKAEERVKELEAIERLSKDSIMKMFDSKEQAEHRLQKLVEAIKQYKVHANDFKGDIAFQKVLGEVSK